MKTKYNADHYYQRGTVKVRALPNEVDKKLVAILATVFLGACLIFFSSNT